MDERHDRLRKARAKAGYSGPTEAAERFAWNPNTYKSNENGLAPFSFRKAKDYAKAFGVRPEWLYDAIGPMTAPAGDLVPVVGRVGASADGRVLYSTGDSPDVFALPMPGGSQKAAALLVEGHSMRGFADDGALIYFEDQRSAPTPDMLNHVIIVETEDGQVLVKRLLRGARKGSYDLESIVGPILADVKVKWAAHISAIIPPYMARRSIRQAGEAA